MAAEKCTREVITLQVGNYSNFVGAHFWNLQESLVSGESKQSEINHGILYRDGRAIAGGRVHIKPRAICFDLKESFSNSQQYAELPDGHEALTWDGTIEKYNRGPSKPEKSEELRKNSTYLNNQGTHDQNGSAVTQIQHSGDQSKNTHTHSYEERITSWLDYSLARFHHNSFNVISGAYGEGQSFGSFASGESLYKTRKFQDSFEDNLHFFVEECDTLEGFQIFTDLHDGFAGLTSGILQDLTEEYPKKARLCFPTMPAVFPDDTRYMANARLLNILLGLPRHISSSSHVVPLTLRDSLGLRSKTVALPWIEYQPSSIYQTSAILATAIDTATLPGRLTSQATTPSSMSFLGGPPRDNRNISALSIGLPIPVNSTYTPRQFLGSYEDFNGHFTSLTPDIRRPRNILHDATTLRGIPDHLLPKTDYQHTERRLQSLLEPVVKYLPGSCAARIVERPCLLTPLFPDIFKSCVTPAGCLTHGDPRGEGDGVHKISAMTRLQCCEEIAELLDGLVDTAKQANLKRQPCFLEEGIEEEDFGASLEDLAVMAQTYHNQYEL